MCTHARIPSGSRRNESASSKSFAVSGSTVKVVNSRRSTRPSRLGSGSENGSNSPRAPCSTSSASSTFSIRLAGPSPRSTRARPRPGRTTARSPTPSSPIPFDSSKIGTPGVKNGSPTTSFPRRPTSTTTRSDGSEAGGANADQPTSARRARTSDPQEPAERHARAEGAERKAHHEQDQRRERERQCVDVGIAREIDVESGPRDLPPEDQEEHRQ